MQKAEHTTKFVQIMLPPRPLFSWWDRDGALESDSVLLMVLDSDGSIGTVSAIAEGYESIPDCDFGGFICVTESNIAPDWLKKRFKDLQDAKSKKSTPLPPSSE